MKSNVHLWQYIAEFRLEWEMFQAEEQKIKTHIFLTRDTHLMQQFIYYYK